MSLGNPSARESRARKRLDYYQLNDGSDTEADRIEHSIASSFSEISIDQSIE